MSQVQSDGKARAILEMVVAASFWGFGFTATVWALQVLSAFQLTLLRFVLAGGAGALYILIRRPKGAWRDNLRLTFWPAVFLLGTLLFQTWGMHYTTVAKSGFITTLYVVFVPLLEAAISRRSLPWTLWACVAAALGGTVMIVGGKISDFNLGDGLVFVCAILATLQIYVLGIISPRVTQPFIFNIVQSCWCAVFMLPVLVLEPVHEKVANFMNWPPLATAGVVMLAFGSTIFAFYLQVRAQAKISATVSSLLFLLESPFALFFAMLILEEQLAPIQATGAVLIFLSAAFASVIEGRRKKF